ncbi:MAG: hypothetical protein HND44_12485 [Chloroflexi bacterium]|nr:hypothetical protein [Ardenticatenaceae bacterium]NOG35374.1 hypothetical protein [Chloroflexota bacterium]GIK58604.1 MAG: hypothetical protein BroJett015_42670 [Chloroflexota bacterium]
MAKSGWSCVLLGVMVTAVVACSKPAIEQDREFSATDEPSLALTEGTQQDLTASTAPTQNQPTIPPPPSPTAAPTTSLYSNWQQAGNATTGLQLQAPPEWVNLSGQLDTAGASNASGLIVLLLSDSTRTGESLLAGKPLGDGAYVAGLVSNQAQSLNTPQAALMQYLHQLNKNITILNEPTPVTAFTNSGSRVTGAYADVVGEPLIFSSGQTDLRTRVLLFTSALTGAVNQNTQAVFLLSAPEAVWPEMEAVLAQMARTIVVHHVEGGFTIRDGAANVMGALGGTDLVQGALSSGIKDIWTFEITGERYATLTLSPQAAALDLTLTLIGPSGQTIVQVDNGYAGDTETAVDLLLRENGRYIVEVGEFFHMAGGYTLRLSLTPQPLFGGGGSVGLGQTIQSTLPPGGEQLWRFTAVAGDVVSVVLNPVNFDVVLYVYTADGRSLVELDEGFSGDAEVVSGLLLPVDGEYAIVVRSFGGSGGSYTLSLDRGGKETINLYDAGDLFYGEIRQEMLQEDETHAWFFNGRAGDEIMADVTPLDNHLDLEMWLVNQDVQRLATVDALLAGQPEYLVYTLPADGQYLLLVRDFFGEPGRYEVSLTAVPADAPQVVGLLTYGQRVQGALTAGQQVVWQFDGRDGDSISARLLPGAQSDLQLVLLDPAGSRVLAVDQAGAGQPEEIAAFILTTDGIWSLLISEFFGETASYTLSLDRQ